MQKLIVSTFSTPLGWLDVRYDEHFVHHAVFVEQKTHQQAHNEAGMVIANEIDAYFHNPHHRFQLALKPQGTIYQQRVWNELLVIPIGRTVTYGELANTLQSGPRAVGQACKKNPIALCLFLAIVS